MTGVNTGLQLDWARRQFTEDAPGKPKMPKPEQPLGPAVTGAPPLQFRLPVTPTYAPLAGRPRRLQLHPKAEPTATLAARDVGRCRSDRRAELWRRERDFVGHVTAASLAPVRQAEVSVRRQGYALQLTTDSVVAQAADGRHLSIDLKDAAFSPPGAPQLELLLEVFEALLLGRPGGLTDGEHDAVSSAFALLIGVGGLFNPQDAPAIEVDRRFSQPKLICWDFNGTVERERNVGFRPDVGAVTDSLNAMGATSVITTSVDPRKVEEAMVQASLRFNAYFGGPEVRPTKGDKHYAAVAAAYALDVCDAPDHMVSIGDSATDIPADMPGVLFINSDSDTPAQWVHQLLLSLDELGQGSFARGLQRCLSGPLEDREQTVHLGDLAFEVALPQNGKRPGASPKITGLRLALDLREMVEVLRQGGGQGMRASGVLRHIENQLPESELQPLLHAVDNTEAAAVVLDSVARRADHRAEEVRVARAAAKSFAEWLVKDPTAKEVASAIEFIVRAGDERATRGLQEVLPAYAMLTRERAQRSALDVVDSIERIQLQLEAALLGPTRASLSPGRDQEFVESLIQAMNRWPRPPEPLEELLHKLVERGCSAELKYVVAEAQELLPTLLSEALQKHTKKFEQRRRLDLIALCSGAETVVSQKQACWRPLFAELEARLQARQDAAV